MRARRPARDEGAAAVEFALVMPLLFLLIIGIIQYGYGFFQLQAAQSTVREAARSAALGIDTCDDWKEIVEDAAEGNGMAVDAIAGSRLEFDRRNVPQTSPPQRGDTLIATLTYAPTLDFTIVPNPDSVTRTARTTVENIAAFDDVSCDPAW